MGVNLFMARQEKFLLTFRPPGRPQVEAKSVNELIKNGIVGISQQAVEAAFGTGSYEEYQTKLREKTKNNRTLPSFQ